MNLEHNLKMVAQVDLPPIPQELIQDLLVWHDSVKKILTNPGAEALNYPWLASTIRDYSQNIVEAVDLNYGISGSSWNREVIDKFPSFVNILNSLPFTKITRVYLLETRSNCSSHVDSSKYLYEDIKAEPCNYRATLRNNPGVHGFYVQPKPRQEWGTDRAIVPGSQGYELNKPIPLIRWNPEVGNWWVLNNYCCQHGSEWKEGDTKVILSIQGTPDVRKHLDIMARSDGLPCEFHPYHTHLNTFYSLP